MKEWDLHITYGLRSYTLRSVVEYESAQIIRIRVYGTKTSILLENNFPLLKLQNSKKAIQWKITEGSLGPGTQETSRLLINIMEQLESLIKKNNY